MAGAEGLARLTEATARTRPVALAREQVLPVLDALDPLVPGGLRRGSTVSVSGGAGATSLALALLGGASTAGSWGAVVGVPSLGLAAAAGLGVAFERLVVVAEPPAGSWATVVATLVDAFELVLAGTGRRVSQSDARRLVARTRERKSVLVVLGGGWSEPADVRLEVVKAEWEGLGDGHGHLRARRVTVNGGGRRGSSRPRCVDLWLPAPDGTVAPVGAELRHLHAG